MRFLGEKGGAHPELVLTHLAAPAPLFECHPRPQALDDGSSTTASKAMNTRFVHAEADEAVVNASADVAKPEEPKTNVLVNPKSASDPLYPPCRRNGGAKATAKSSIYRPIDMPPGSRTAPGVCLGESEVFQSPSRVDFEKYAHCFVGRYDTDVFGPPSRIAADLAVYLDATPTVIDTSNVVAKPTKLPLSRFSDPKLASEAIFSSILRRGADDVTTRPVNSVIAVLGWLKAVNWVWG